MFALTIGALVLSRARGAGAVTASIALGLCTLTVLAQPRSAANPREGIRLRVVTHNVWTDNVDASGTAAVLERSGADILFLQETEGQFASVLPVLARTFPYSSGCKHRCALIILSRFPIESTKLRRTDRPWRRIDPGMMLDARIRLPGSVGIIPVVTVHLARGQARGADLRQRAELAQALKRADGNASILAGDFNLVPWSARMRMLDAALAPLARATAAFSWPARFEKRDVPFPLVPIDHVYAGSGWALESVRRLERTGSDHYPIAVDLIWQGQNAMVTSAR
ncbi:endonuclease/exonuclease/phosphatase family protein [Novosphingobium sp. 9U]|uniref:endonuclease/exonuclease/phosphatase family protein n=1 Tax=Novosphingobium sp. 9U TaxID=2653158 RepID=UPI00135CB9EB|nr:endonuclease/exonuclease/phosphatase family protein [Novosphingobium sp. 9U]